MAVRRAVGYIPEFKLTGAFVRRLQLTSGISLLTENSELASNLREELKANGYQIEGGSYLYFDGTLNDDGTLYEVFQGYSLALTFFDRKGRATCRAVKDLDENSLELFIDEYDKFRYEKDDVIFVKRSEIKKVKSIYARVEKQLENKDFNPLRNSLEFFIIFLSEKPIRTRLMFLCICLESTLLEGENEGLSYKLGVRCANLLNAFYAKVDRVAIFEEIKNAYSLRSKIVHGDDYKKESDKIIKKRGGAATELDHVLNLESVIKDILSIIFGNQELYDASISGGLGKLVDKKYILDR